MGGGFVMWHGIARQISCSVEKRWLTSAEAACCAAIKNPFVIFCIG